MIIENAAWAKLAFEMIKQTLSNNIEVTNVHNMYGIYICKYHTIMLVCMVVYNSYRNYKTSLLPVLLSVRTPNTKWLSYKK